MADLKITGLHKYYGNVHAVRGIDLEIPAGEFTVLVGQSGCGKSTLLRTIAGLEDADEGTIEIGVRPEDLKVAEPEAGEAGATVVEVEPLGGYTVVTLDAGATRLRALMRGQPDIRPQSRVALRCDPARLHFFGQGGGVLVR